MMHQVIITIACMAGFFLIGFVAGRVWELLG